MNNAATLIKDTWFQLWLVTAVAGGLAALYSLGQQPAAASAPAVLPVAAPVAVAIPAPPVVEAAKAQAQAALKLAVVAAKKPGTWIVDVEDSPDRDTDSVLTAVAKAKDGDLILIRPGRYPGGIQLQKSLTLKGEPKTAAPVVIESNGESTLVQKWGKSRVEMLELREIGSPRPGDGILAAVVVTGGQLALQDVQVYSAGLDGILAQMGELEIHASTIGGNGIGIYVASSLKCDDCRLVHNGGSGIFVDASAAGPVEIRGSTFLENTVALLANAAVRVEDTVFRGNNEGMNLWAKGTVLKNVLVEGTRQYGVGISRKADVLIQDSKILNSGGVGIALYDDGRLTLKGSRVNGSGMAGVMASGRGRLIAHGNDFTGNSDGAFKFSDLARAEGSKNKPPLPRR